MKLIPLTQGKFAQVDDEDYDYLMQWKWYATKYKYTWYAKRSSFRETKTKGSVWMHRVILKLTDRKLQGDHKDHNGLNNQRSNLRIATQTQNNSNRRFKNKYVGVSNSRRKGNPFRAVIVINKKNIHLGMFKNQIEAAMVYNEAALKHFGEFARLNEIPVNV